MIVGKLTDTLINRQGALTDWPQVGNQRANLGVAFSTAVEALSSGAASIPQAVSLKIKELVNLLTDEEQSVRIQASSELNNIVCMLDFNETKNVAVMGARNSTDQIVRALGDDCLTVARNLVPSIKKLGIFAIGEIIDIVKGNTKERDDIRFRFHVASHIGDIFEGTSPDNGTPLYECSEALISLDYYSNTCSNTKTVVLDQFAKMGPLMAKCPKVFRGVTAFVLEGLRSSDPFIQAAAEKAFTQIEPVASRFLKEVILKGKE